MKYCHCSSNHEVSPHWCIVCELPVKEGNEKFDMNKVEEYIQGDHGRVISPNY